MKPGVVRTGDVVTIRAFDEVPECLFLIEEVLDGSVKGPLAGEYGEPEIHMILRVLGPQGTQLSLQGPEKIRKSGNSRNGGECP
jgi:hypothetical protein